RGIFNAARAVFLPSMKQDLLRGLLSALFKRRWLVHLLFWLGYYLFYSVVVVFGVYQVHDLTFYFQLCLFFPFDIALVYFNFYVLIPRLLSTGKYLYYGLALFASMLVSAVIVTLIKQMYAHFGSALFAISSS